MKKLLFLAFALAFFCACSDDDSGIGLEKTEIELLSDESYTILSSSDHVLTYTSDNNFVATVSSQGVIEAQRIGHAKISVSDGETVEYISVKINPKYDLYPEPFLEFGTKRSDIIARFGIPTQETEQGISYIDNTNTAKAPVRIFLFDDNDRLSSTNIGVRTEYSSILGSFLNERYLLYTYDEEEATVFFVDGLTDATISMAVAATIYTEEFWLITYFPYLPSKAMTSLQLPDQDLLKLFP